MSIQWVELNQSDEYETVSVSVRQILNLSETKSKHKVAYAVQKDKHKKSSLVLKFSGFFLSSQLFAV